MPDNTSRLRTGASKPGQVLVQAALAMVLATASANAADIVWTGGAGSEGSYWDLAQNWTASELPGPLDNALIGIDATPIFRTGVVDVLSLQAQGDFVLQGGSLTTIAPSSIGGSLSLSGGNLGVDSTFLIEGTPGQSSIWSGGTITGGIGVGGITTFEGALALSGNSDTRAVNGGIVNFAGTTTWNNNPGGDNAFGAISTGNGATLNNAGFWFDTNIANPTTINNNLGGAQGTFNNIGSYIKLGSATTTISTIFNNEDLAILDVEGGVLSLNGGGSSSGVLNVASGAILNFSGGTFAVSNLAAGALAGTGEMLISGGTVNANGSNHFAGTLAVSGGILNVAGPFDDTEFVMTGGTLNANGALSVSGAATWTSGTLSSPGGTTFLGNLALSSNSDQRVLSGGTVNFAGITTWTNSPGGDNAFGAINTSGNAVLNNSGTWLDEISSNPSYIFGAQSTFNNSGSYIKSGTSATTIYTVFNNTGILDVEAGTLGLTGGGTIGGSVNVAAGAVLNFNGGTYAVSNLGAGVSAGTGTGQLLLTAGTFNANGSNAFPGTIAVSGGTLNLNGPLNTVGFTMNGGTVAGAGALTISGAASWTAGTITGPGSTTFNGPLALSGNSDGRALSGGTVNFAGTTTWTNSPGGDNAFGAIATSGNAVLNNSGTFLDEIASNPSYVLGAQSTFNNSGSYIKTGTSSTTFAGSFINTGTLEVTAGELLLNKFSEIDGLPELDVTVASQVNDVLDISSSAALYGLITVDFAFKPTTGEVITVFDYGSHTGTFSSVTADGLAAGLSLTPVYNATDFQVIVGAPVPLPASIWLFATGLLGLVGQGLCRRTLTEG